MNTQPLALIETVRDIAMPQLQSIASSFDSAISQRDSCTLRLPENLFECGLDSYQVALISVEPRRVGPGIPEDTVFPQVLLLPLTWEHLVRHVLIKPSEGRDVAEFGEIWIDFSRCEARCAELPVPLTATEFKILKFFTSNPYRVISRNELLNKVWGYNCYPTTRTVDNRILSLRQKLERDPANPVYFRTVYGVGYKFVPR